MKYFLLPLLLLSQLFAAELSLDHADQLADKAIAEAKAQNIAICVSIVDQHGNLKALKRMDGTPLMTLESSQMKAFTSASAPYSTRLIANMAAKDPNHALTDVPGLLLLPGGLPIFSASGEHIGGIGIGGGSADQDEACAQAALKSDL